MHLRVASSLFICGAWLAACGSNPPPAQPAPPAPASSGAAPDAGAAAKPTASPSPPVEKLSCPSPEIAAKAQSCDDIEQVTPSYGAILDAQTKLTRESASPRPGKRAPAPKTDAERLAARPMTKDDLAFVRLARSFLCQRAARAEEHAEVEYSLARHYFERQHWEEAAVLFDDIAQGPIGDTSIYAAQLSLEAINVLQSKLQRKDCLRTLEVRTDQYLAHLCKVKQVDTEACATLAKIKEDLRAMKK